MKRVLAVLLFLISIGGVVGLTRWMPSSPIASVFADDHGGRQGTDGRPPGRDGQNGHNRETADVSFGSVFETLGTLAPDAAIVAVFGFTSERGRRRRNKERRATLGVH